MPHYEIFHTCPIDNAQKQHLARAITTLHCTTFSAPSLFVNITFHYYFDNDRGQNYSRTMFVGGEEVSTNYIIGHLRDRTHLPSNRDTLNSLVEQITALWNQTLQPKKPGSLDDRLALHNVFVMGDIAAAAEQGLVVPLAGEDGKWAEKNREEIERRAGEGEESMVALLGEMEKGWGNAVGDQK